jgi:hypothetical protein
VRGKAKTEKQFGKVKQIKAIMQPQSLEKQLGRARPRKKVKKCKRQENC